MKVADEPFAGAQVEAGSRFVEHEELGVAHHRPGQQHLLALAFGEHAVRAGRGVGESGPIEQVVGPSVVGGVIGVPPGLEGGKTSGEDDLGGRELGAKEARDGAAHEADPGAELADVNPAQPMAENVNGARRRMQVARREAEKRGLARPVRSEHDPALAGGDRPRQAAEGGDTGSPQRDRVEVEDTSGRHRRTVPFGPSRGGSAMGLIESLGSGPSEDDFDDGGHGEPPESPEKRKPRVRTSTKVVVIAAVWVLFTLFLVGRFSAGKDTSVSARLDTNVQGSGEDAALEVVDSEEEVALDADGDGFLTAEEQGIVEGSSSSSEGGDGSGSDGSDGGGGPATSEAGVYEGTATPAVPGAAPGGGSTGGGSTSGGSTGGGSTGAAAPATTTTTSKSTSSTSTSKPATTTTPTTQQGGGGSPTTAQPETRTIAITGGNPTNYRFDPADVTLPAGSTVVLQNKSNRSHVWKITGRESVDIPKDKTREATFSTPGRYDYLCTIETHLNMRGTITVT